MIYNHNHTHRTCKPITIQCQLQFSHHRPVTSFQLQSNPKHLLKWNCIHFSTAREHNTDYRMVATVTTDAGQLGDFDLSLNAKLNFLCKIIKTCSESFTIHRVRGQPAVTRSAHLGSVSAWPFFFRQRSTGGELSSAGMKRLRERALHMLLSPQQQYLDKGRCMINTVPLLLLSVFCFGVFFVFFFKLWVSIK